MVKERVGDILTLIVVIGLMVLAFLALRRMDSIRKDNVRLSGIITEKNAALEFTKNEVGRLVAEKKAAEIEAKDLKRMYPEIYNAITKELNIKTKELKAYIKSEIEVAASGKGVINNNHYYTLPSGDTVRVSQYSMDDGFLKFKANLLDSSYTYLYQDTVKQAIALKKKWLLGKESLYGSATLSNPSAKVVGSQSILINDYKDKRFGLGIGILYDPFSGQPHFGVGLQYNLIKF